MTSYCKLCGTKLWREYRYNAAGVVMPEYYNHDIFKSAGPTGPWKIEHCQGCGEQLREEVIANH